MAARITLNSLAARVSGLEDSFAAEKAASAQRHEELVALIQGKSPAKPARQRTAKRPSAGTRTAPKRSTFGVMTKTNRRDFVKDGNDWAEGWSTLDIAIAVVHFGAETNGWTVHEYLVEKAGRATAAAKRAVKAAL